MKETTATPSPILSLQDVSRTFRSGSRMVQVLQGIDLDIAAGETCAIVGPSGSGKTTLLGLCAGLDTPSSGHISLCGSAIAALNEDERAELRNRQVGFVFQNFNLLSALTALENVMVPMELLGMKQIRSQAMELLDRVGLADRYDHYPSQLSGGEQQRVAIARAFANQPGILFADEPTGNLDEETGERVEDLLFALNRDAGTTLVVVTHDLELARKTQRMVRLKGGKMAGDERIMAPH